MSSSLPVLEASSSRREGATTSSIQRLAALKGIFCALDASANCGAPPCRFFLRSEHKTPRSASRARRSPRIQDLSQSAPRAHTMYGGGREKKSKVTKRSKLAVAAASAEAEADGAVWQPKPSKRDQFLKSADDTLYLGGKQKSKRRPVVVDDEFELEENGPLARRGAAWQPPQGETPFGSALFVRWEEMLGSREALKRRLDSIAAVHGWEFALRAPLLPRRN